MHFSSTIILLAAAASSVSASHGNLMHRHHSIHERRHVERREPMMFYKDTKPADKTNSGNNASAGVDDKKTEEKTSPNANATPQNTNPAPAPVPNQNAPGGSPAAVDSTPAAGSDDRSGGAPSTGTGQRKPFCGGAATNIKRATMLDITFKGNVGAPGKWGCNIMEIDCGDAGLYDYTTVFEGGNSHDIYSCSAFNKIGPTDQVDPGWHSALDFQVARGAKKCLAYDKNSQGSIACNGGAGGPMRTQWGQMASTWYEFDCGSSKNDHQSGSDVSVLVANSANQPFIGMAIEAPGKGQCSWIKSSGEKFAAYTKGMEAEDGVGCTGYSKGQTKVILGF